MTKGEKYDIIKKLSKAEVKREGLRSKEDLNAWKRRFTEPERRLRNFLKRKMKKVLDKSER